jgi:hypothetical protein
MLTRVMSFNDGCVMVLGFQGLHPAFNGEFLCYFQKVTKPCTHLAVPKCVSDLVRPGNRLCNMQMLVRKTRLHQLHGPGHVEKCEHRSASYRQMLPGAQRCSDRGSRHCLYLDFIPSTRCKKFYRMLPSSIA